MLSPTTMSIWAKAPYSPERPKWLPLWLHLSDTAAVARHLAAAWMDPAIHDLVERELAGSPSGLATSEEFSLLASWLGGCHDIGKATPAFSVQGGDLDTRMREAGLAHEPIDSHERRRVPHGLAGQRCLEDWLVTQGWSPRQTKALASVVGAHHGIPVSRAQLSELGGRMHLIGEGSWEKARHELLGFITRRTGASELLDAWKARSWSEPFLVLLSALVIVSDWLASSEDYFPLLGVEDDGRALLDDAAHSHRVAAGLARLEFPAPWTPDDDGTDADTLLATRFDLPEGSRATEVQRRAVEAARSAELPGILIIEDATGGGKTEAGLLAAEILAARTGRSGILFALPTQATTDAMFRRTLDWLSRIEAGRGRQDSLFSVNLQHGRARLNEDASALRIRGDEIHSQLLGTLGGEGRRDGIWAGPRPTGIGIDEPPSRRRAALPARDGTAADLAILSWFAGRKKSMLSDFVITTIDHLLFGALRSRHLALRHLGLARKVVIIDEAHAYSTYMYVYLERALTWLGAYGVPVIVLSATLSAARSGSLVTAYRQGLELASGSRVRTRARRDPIEAPFPCLITAGRTATEVHPVSSAGRRSSVGLQRLPRGSLLPLLQDRLADGGCALIVRNTVRRAQETYAELQAAFGHDVTLAHARFTVGDRLAKDKDLLRRFGPPRSRPDRPRRAIVVSTQVVEQSLDVDFDLLITDLAPIDLVLQRLGRLHRHSRTRPPGLREPVCYIDWLPSSTSSTPALEPGAKAIYGEHDLLRSAAALDEVIRSSGTVTTPDDVRELIEAVYGPDAALPRPWQEAFTGALARSEETERAKARAAEGFLLRPPARSGSTASLVGWLDTAASDDEDKGRAQVRDGGDSLEVILLDLHRSGGSDELRTLPAAPGMPGIRIPTDSVPERSTVETMLRSAIRLPASLTNERVIDRVITELESRMFPAWQAERDLAGQLFLILEDGRAVLDGKILEYSSTTGLREVQ